MERTMKIRELRAAANLTQRQVAARLNVSPGAVAQWELGTSKPTMDNLLALASLFGCTLDALCGLEPACTAQAGAAS